MALKVTERDSQHVKERVRHIQQLHCTGRDSKRQPATIRDSEKHVATQCNRRYRERQPSTPWQRKRQREADINKKRE